MCRLCFQGQPIRFLVQMSWKLLNQCTDCCHCWSSWCKEICPVLCCGSRHSLPGWSGMLFARTDQISMHSAYTTETCTFCEMEPRSVKYVPFFSLFRNDLPLKHVCNISFAEYGFQLRWKGLPNPESMEQAYSFEERDVMSYCFCVRREMTSFPRYINGKS